MSLPYGHLLSPKASAISTNGWVAAVDEYYNREPAIRYAALAMSAGFMGVQDRNNKVAQYSQLTLQGLEAYNRAIHEMVKGLKDARRSKNDGVLVAARILQSYEVRVLHEAIALRKLTTWPMAYSYFSEAHLTGVLILKANCPSF